MHSTLVMTSSWWLASPPIDAWRLAADVPGWPRWWSAVAHGVRTSTDTDLASGALDRPVSIWRTLAGARLRLRVSSAAGAPGSRIDMRIRGDLHGSATWLFAPAQTSGTEVICRWELRVPGNPGRWWGLFTQLLFERRHFARMRGCSLGMGVALGCAVHPLREWSGARRQ